MRALSLGAAIVALAILAGGISTAAAQGIPVDLELVLAVDVSRSMDLDEQELQRQGYLEAITAPEVIQAIRTGAYGRIAGTNCSRSRTGITNAPGPPITQSS